MTHCSTHPTLSTRTSVAKAGVVARFLLVALLMLSAFLRLQWGMPDISAEARAALLVFAFALLAWSVLRWDETPVAILCCLALVGASIVPADTLYESLGNELIWLLLGAFVLSAVLQGSGLAQRGALRLVAGAATASGLCRRLCWVIMATAFVIPSTSARAALLLPVFLALSQSIAQPRVTRALALLFPTMILLSAGASLLGAGAHLVAVDFIERSGGERIDFLRWAWWGLPFSMATCAIATELILCLFLTRSERREGLHLPSQEREPLSAEQRNILAICALSIAAWMGGSWLGLDAAFVALCAALAATCRPLTGMGFAQTLKKLEWNLLLFLAATTMMGQALLDTGAAQAIAQSALQALPLAEASSIWIVGAAATLSVLSHLVITSRTARAVVVIPVIALPLAAAGNADAALLIFVCVQGSGFCQTLVVSAKPVALFAKTDGMGCAPSDLLKLAAVLAPCMIALLMLFAVVVWPAQGLGL